MWNEVLKFVGSRKDVLLASLFEFEFISARTSAKGILTKFMPDMLLYHRMKH